MRARNFFILLLIKYASATMMFVANTVTIPIANLGFSIPFVTNGGPTQVSSLYACGVCVRVHPSLSCACRLQRAKITWEGLLSLFLTLCGMIVYQVCAVFIECRVVSQCTGERGARGSRAGARGQTIASR